MAGNKINICLIGAGRMGERWAHFIDENKKTNLSLVVDKDLKTASSVAKKYKTSFSSKLPKSLDEIDAFVVVTPHKYLYKYSKEALSLGKSVLVEKPGCTNVEQMKELNTLAKKNKTIFMIGYNYRFIDSVAEAKRIVEKGKIGDVLFIRIKHGHAGRKGYNEEWRMNKKESGGGALMDQGVHVIDLARWFLSSEPNKVKSFTSNKYWESGVEDNAFVLLKNKDKQTASLHVSITEWSPTFLMEVVGTKGYCKISGFGKKYDDGETLTTGALDKNHKISKQYKKYKVVPFDSVRKELDCFVRSIKKKKNMGPSGADGVGVLEIVKKAYKNE